MQSPDVLARIVLRVLEPRRRLRNGRYIREANHLSNA
jgi:hypothetical protein